MIVFVACMFQSEWNRVAGNALSSLHSRDKSRTAADISTEQHFVEVSCPMNRCAKAKRQRTVKLTSCCQKKACETFLEL